jgi:hypothetical protein
VDELKAVVKRAESGDEAALKECRQYLRQGFLGARSMPDLVIDALLDRLVPSQEQFSRECVCQQVEAVQRDLEGPSPTPLVRMLARCAAVAWLAYHVDQIRSEHVTDLGTAMYYERSLTLRQKRFHRAVAEVTALRRVKFTASLTVETST